MRIERPWRASYPPTVPHEIDVHAYASIVDVLRASVERFRDRIAFSCMGTSLTYADVDRLSTQFAAYLRGELQLRTGDRVAIMLPNCLQYPIAIFGILRAGLTVVNVNPLYTPRELRHQLRDSGARVLLVLDHFGRTVTDVLDDVPVEHVVLTGLGDLLHFPKRVLVHAMLRYAKRLVPEYTSPRAVRFRRALARGRAHVLPDITLGHEDLAFLQYTGGTTGVAKGAMLTHGNLVANMQQASAWIAPVARESQELIVTALPLYHIFALTANGLVFMKLGAHNHLITNPRDLPRFVRELSRIPFTAITGVNTLFNALLETPGFSEIDFTHLRLTLGGGMAVQRAVADRWKQVTGCTLVEAYGLTETSPAACMNLMNLTEFSGAIGYPVPSTDACVMDDTGQRLPAGEIGELCIRGPQVMKGYWQRPEETAAVLDADGWLHTGDLARMDATGLFSVVDRKKDMILVSGFNVYPSEIEDVIAMMPEVREVGAVGVPDERSGEAVKVVIVKKDPRLTADAVKAFARQHLTGYKRPTHVEFREALPKSNVGKILRRELRE